MAGVYSGCTSGAPRTPVEELTIADVHAQLMNGSFTCSELVQAYLQARCLAVARASPSKHLRTCRPA